MKTIGIIGGMSWESTQTYYAQINRGINRALGGLHSARLLLYSVDFAEIEALQHKGEWQATADILIQAARTLEMAGVDFLLIATNTPLNATADVVSHFPLPFLHIAFAPPPPLTPQTRNAQARQEHDQHEGNAERVEDDKKELCPDEVVQLELAVG